MYKKCDVVHILQYLMYDWHTITLFCMFVDEDLESSEGGNLSPFEEMTAADSDKS